MTQRLSVGLLALTALFLVSACGASDGPRQSATAAAATAPAVNAIVLGHAPATSDISETTLSLMRGSETIRSTRADRAGNYRIADVEPGHYTLAMDAVGRESARICPSTSVPGEGQSCLIPPATSERRDFDVASGEEHREDF